MLPIGNNIGRHQRCPLMLPPVTRKGRCCLGLSAHWLAHAFAWWRLLPCVIVWWVALVRFCPWIPSGSTLTPVLQTLSEALQKPLRRLGRTQACALRYSLIRWWVSTVGLSLPVGSHYTPICALCNPFLDQCVISKYPCYAHAKTVPSLRKQTPCQFQLVQRVLLWHTHSHL